MPRELHISSLLIQHRHDALPRLQALIDRHTELEIALQEDCRCVVLCETDDQRAVMDHIDAMQNLSGVLSVSLIYHHAEPRSELEKPMRQILPEGASV
jgi:nitrate reductase NapD